MEGRLIANRYEIIERIGGGGMAVVYKAIDQVLDRYVAIKILHDNLHHEEGIHRFIREAQNAGRLSHPNIVSVHDAGREGETHYIVMEYMEGDSLKEWIQKQGPLSPVESIDIAMQICDGLDHAHKNGIIHRDIKPHNILRARNGQFKITDFGISFFSNATQLTQTGIVMGSVHYFSPEQASGNKVDSPSDLYSLGVVLYEMVTGQVPFDAESYLSVVLKHVQAPIPDPQTINPNVPSELCNIIFQAMDKDPNNRFQTASEMKQALQGALEKDQKIIPSLGTTSEQVVNHSDLPRRNHKKRLPKKKVLVGLILVTFATFGFLYLVRPSLNSEATPSFEPGGISQEKTHLEGNYRWWREIPKSGQKNGVFRNFRANGTNGEYDVQLEVQNLSSPQFYYNIWVVDNFSGRPILLEKSVPYRNSQGKVKKFHVSIPEALLPSEGLLKITFYCSNGGKKTDAISFLLQQWGNPPKK